MSIELSEQEQLRRQSLAALRELGIDPYPAARYEVTATAREIAENFDPAKNNFQGIRIAGRIMSRRIMGSASFFELQDHTGRIQVYIRRDDICPEGDPTLYNTVFKKLLDIGDIVGVEGFAFRTNTGELSVHCQKLTLLSKSLRPLPVVKEKDGQTFDAFTDPEIRYRQRYVDLIVNPHVREVFIKRSKIISTMREYFNQFGYVEVETPILQPIPGGAAARPFTTHMNAFDLDLYLRIAPELFLKRCLVGGIDRVFEINRDFRNEGVDATHAPEFTMVEAYQAYGNYDTIGALVKQLVQDTAMDVFGSHKGTLLDGTEYDFGGEWKTISMYDSLSEALGEEIVPNGGPDNPGTSVEHLGEIADKLGVERDDVENHGKLVEHLWEHFYEDKLYEPTFVRDFPVETSPLVKGHRSKAGVVEKWDLYVRGFELATGYSELNDPVVQRERFVAQAKDALAGDEEACDIDEDFLEALGVGMPPAGGMGMGIDRLLIALTGATIRETITFPLVKPLVG